MSETTEEEVPETPAEDTEELQDIGNKMTPQEDTRAVAYASYLQFLSKIKTTQDYRIIAKFVKEKFQQAKAAGNIDRAKKLKEVYYILSYYANMKDEFDKTIGDYSKTLIDDTKPDEKDRSEKVIDFLKKQVGIKAAKRRQFSLLSDVSPHIAIATKQQIAALIEKSNEIIDKIKLKNEGEVPTNIEGFHKKIKEIQSASERAPKFEDYELYLKAWPSPNEEQVNNYKNLKTLGIAVAELFGPLLQKPRGYRDYVIKDVLKIKAPTAPEAPASSGTIDFDRPDTGDFSRFYEGLNRISTNERNDAIQSIQRINDAKDDDKKTAFWDMMSSLEYHIYTGFSVLKNKGFKALNAAFKENVAEGNDLLNHLANKIVTDMLGNKIPEGYKAGFIIGSPRDFTEFLVRAKEKEKQQLKDKETADQDRKQFAAKDELKKDYVERFKFISEQPEAKEGMESFNRFWRKIVANWNKDNFIKALEIANALDEGDYNYANPNLQDLEAKIRARKVEKLKTIKSKEAGGLIEKYEDKYGVLGDGYSHELYQLEKEYQKIIASPKKKSTSTPRGPDYSRSSFRLLIEKMLEQEIIVENTTTIEVLLEFEKFLEDKKTSPITENAEWSERVDDKILEEFDKWYENYHRQTWIAANPTMSYREESHAPKTPRSKALKDALEKVYNREDIKDLFNKALKKLLPQSSETSKDPEPKPKRGPSTKKDLENLIKKYIKTLEKNNKKTGLWQKALDNLQSSTPGDREYKKVVALMRRYKENGIEQFQSLSLEEQLTKILAPYLMERIKNRKPIDNRLINMLKPLKANKRKRK